MLPEQKPYITLPIGLAYSACTSCAEADEKESQLKQKLDAAQAPGSDVFVVLGRVYTKEKLRLLHDLQAGVFLFE